MHTADMKKTGTNQVVKIPIGTPLALEAYCPLDDPVPTRTTLPSEYTFISLF